MTFLRGLTMGEQEILSEIRERVVRVQTKIDTMSEVQKEASDAKETANEALSSSKSAHKRINKIDKAIFWLVTTIIGAVIVNIISILGRW